MFLPFLSGAAAAVAVAAVLLLAARGRSWGAGTAAGVAYAAGHAAVLGLPPLRISDTTHGLFWIGVAGALAGATEWSAPASRVRMLLMRAALLAPAGWLLARPRIRYAWSGFEATVWIAGLALAGAVFGTALGWLASRVRAERLHAGIAVGAGVVGGLLAGTGSLLLGALGVALAAAHGVASVEARLRHTDRSPGGATLAAGLLLPALWFQGCQYSETPLYSAALFAIAPALAILVARHGRGSADPSA